MGRTAALAEETAYEAKRAVVDGILKDIMSEESIKLLADGIARSSIPSKKLSEATVAKVLLNSYLYRGTGSITDIANSTELRGLGKRKLGGLDESRRSPKHQRKSWSSTRTPVPHNVVNNNEDIPKLFTRASYLVGDNYVNNRDSAFLNTLKTRNAEMNTAFDAATAKNSRRQESASSIVMDMLAKELELRSYSGTERTCALVPISMLIPRAIYTRSADDQMRLLCEFGKLVRENLSKQPADGRKVISPDDLPVSRNFSDRFLSNRNVEVDDVGKYLSRWGLGIWDDMFNCYAFSLTGRAVNHTELVVEQLYRVLQNFDKTMADRYRAIIPDTEIFAVTTPTRKQAPRIWIIGTYGGENAIELLRPAVEYCATNRNRDFGKSYLRHMLYLVGLTVSSLSAVGSIPGLERFSCILGSYRMW